MRGCLLLALVLGLAASPSPLFPQAAGGEGELTLRPGDVIRVQIWREEALSGDFHVDSRGLVVLPLLGEVHAEGRSWAALRDELLEGYRREIRNPSIQLTPLRRVHILGEVNAPGLYAVDPTLSLLGAIAMAGGTLPQGDVRNLQVVREGEVILDRVEAESALAGVDVRSGDQVFVGRRGWFDRNSTFLVTAALSLTSIIVTLVAR